MKCEVCNNHITIVDYYAVVYVALTVYRYQTFHDFVVNLCCDTRTKYKK